MVNKVNRDAFKKLKKLSLKKRLEFASSPAGQSMLALLTPSQFADLFPRYYAQGLPDIGGFREAISRKSQQKQQDILSGLSSGQGKTLDDAERTGRQIREGSTGTGGTGGRTGSTGGGSTGPGGGGNLKQMIDRAAAREGIDPRIMYGIVNGESGHGDKYDFNGNIKTGDMSYGPFQMNILKQGMEGDRFQKSTGLSVKDPSSLQEQAYWIAKRIKEMGSDPSKINAVWHGYKGNVDWNPKWGSMGAGGAGSDITPSGGKVSGATPSAAGGPSTAGAGGGKYVSPVEGVFGRTSGNVFAADRSQGNRLHAGVDWTAKNGSDVVAPIGGKVLYSGHHSGYQHMIDILGDDGKIHRLAPHGAVGSFKVGERVEQGQKVGTIDRAHLHYEIIPPSSSAFKEMSKGGNFVQTSWFPGQSPKTEDPSQALGIQPGTKVGVGGSLTVQQSQEERTKNSQEALGEIIKANPDHPFSKMIEKKMEMQGQDPNKAPTEKIGETAAPEIKPGGQPTVSVAPVQEKIKYDSFKFDADAYWNEVNTKHPEASWFGYDKKRVLNETYQGLEEAQKEGAIKFNKSTGEVILLKPESPTVKKIFQEMKDNNIDRKNFLFSTGKKEAEAQAQSQTASLGEKIKREFGVSSAQAAEGGAWQREEEYRKKHVYGPELPTQDKVGVSTDKMRSKIEAYYGQKINDHEYDMLIRATHAESSAKRHVPQEHAMIMGTILNRAKKDGGIEKALMKRSQFEAVTGRTKGQFSPNAAYKAGPGERRMASINSGVMDYLHNVPSNQTFFTSERGDRSSWHKRLVAMGGDVHGGTRFGTKLGESPVPVEAPKVYAQAQTGAIGPSPATPPSVTLPQPVEQPPTTMEKIQREVFPGGGATAQAKPVAAPTPAPSTPTATPTPTTGTPAPPPTPAPVVAPDESSTKNFLKSQGIPGASDGGSFNVPGQVDFYPMDRRDNMAAVDTRTQQPLFTARGGERIDVTPAQKVNGGNVRPSDNGMKTEFEALRQEMNNQLASSGRAPVAKPVPFQETKNEDPSFINNLVHQNKDIYRNPASRRAFDRIKFDEKFKDHYGEGTTNA